MKNKNLLIIFFVVATELIGFGLIIPILPQIALKTQASGLEIGILMSAFSAAQMIGAPILGRWSDKYGRKPVLIASKIGTVLSYLILAYAPSYSWFLISRLLDGFTGGNISTARAYIADITTEENRSKGMAVIGIAFGIGFVLGPAIGGLVYQYGNKQFWPAVVAGIASAIALLLTIIFLKEPENRTAIQETSISKRFKNACQSKLAPVFGIQLIFMTLFAGFETTFAIYLYKLFAFSESQNSLVFMGVGLLMLVVQGYLSRKTVSRLLRTCLFGLTVSAFGFAGLGMIQNIGTLGIALVCLGVGIGCVFTFVPAYISTLAPSTQKGEILGIYESIGSLGRILGPLIAMSMIFNFLRLSYISAGAILLIATIGFAFLTKDKSSS